MTMTSQLFGKYEGGRKVKGNKSAMGGTKLDHPHCKECLKGHEKDMGSDMGATVARSGNMKLGGGGRFAALKEKLSDRPGVTNPGGLAAFIGRKKLGKAKFQKLAAKGR